MADPDSNYASNKMLSITYFNGEPIPDNRLIPEYRLIQLKTRVDWFINKLLGRKKTAGNISDEYGDIEEFAIHLFGLAYAGLPLYLPRDAILTIKRWYTGRKGIYNPTT